MTQYAYPVSPDISTGGWTTTPLWGYIDEEPYVDGDYITSSKNAANDTFECTLGSTITDPGVGTGHVLRVRLYCSKSNNGTATIALYEGASQRASYAIPGYLATGFTEYNYTLSEGEANAISSYSALSVRVIASCSANAYVYCSWARFEAPDAVTYVTLAGVVGGISNVPVAPMERTRRFTAPAISGTSNIPTSPLERIRRFTAPVISGLSSVIADLTKIGGGVIQTFQGSISAVSNIPTVALKKLRGLAGSIISSDVFLDGDFEAWNSPTDLTNWSEYLQGSSTVNQESSIVYSGVYAVRLDIDSGGSLANINQQITLGANKNVIFEFYYRTTDVAKHASVRVSDSGDNVNLRDDLNGWQVGFNTIQCDGVLTYTKKTIQFVTHPDYTQYLIRLIGATYVSFSCYFDKASIRKSASEVSGVLNKFKRFIGSTVSGISNVANAPLERIRRFTAPVISGLSSVIADLTKIGGGVIQTFQGSISAVSNIPTVALKKLRGLVGEISGVNFLTDGDFEEWNTPIDLTQWAEFISGSSTVNRESSDVISGKFSCRMDIDATEGAAEISENFTLTEEGSYVFSVFYKNSLSGKTQWIRIRDSASNVYLNSDGGWQVSACWIVISNSTDWANFRISFMKHPSYSVYRLYIARELAASSSIYWDKASIRRSASQVSGVLNKFKRFIGSTVSGISNVANAPLERIRRFTAPVISGLSSVLGDLTVILGGGIQLLQGSISALSEVTGNLVGTFSFKGTVGAVSNIVTVPLKRLRAFAGKIISPDVLTDGGLNIWTSPTDLTNWSESATGSSTVNRESSEVVEGAFACRFDVDGSNSMAQIWQVSIPLTPGKRYVLRFSHKCSSAGTNRVGWRFRDDSQTVDLGADGNWYETPQYPNISSDTDYDTFEIYFTAHPDYSNYRLFLQRGTGATGLSIYLDDVSIRLTNAQITGVLSRIRRFTAPVIEGLSSVIGNITTSAVKLLQGAIGGISSIADAPMKRITSFIGSVGSISGVAGALSVVYKFVGVAVQGVSSVVGNLTTLGTVYLQGAISALSEVTGNLRAKFNFSGVAEGLSGVTGAFKRVRAFVGDTVSGLSNITGILKRGRRFIGETVQGLSSVSGFLRILKKFVAIPVAAVSGVSGVLSTLGTVLLSGVIGAVSGVDGILKATFSLKGSADGVSGVSGTMKRTVSFSGLVAAFSSLSGTLATAATILFQGAVGAISDITGDLKRSRGFTATISAISGVVGAFKRIRGYIGSISVVSTVDGVLKRLRRMGGVIAVNSAVDGYVKILKRFIGAVTASSFVSAPLGRVKKFVGEAISAVSSVTGNLWAGVLYIYPIIFRVVPRVKTFLVTARNRIFKSDIEEDR